MRDLPYPLRRPGDTALHPVPAPPPSDERLREGYLSCFCCPPNIARTLARFHERAAAVGDDGLYLHQYGGSDVRAEQDGRVLALREDSDYPWDERIAFTVTDERRRRHARCSCASPAGRQAPPSPSTARLPRSAPPGRTRASTATWAVGDVVVLDLPMPVRVLRGHRLAEETTNQVAVQRGPVVYCLESADLPDGVRLEQAACGAAPRSRRSTRRSPDTASSRSRPSWRSCPPPMRTRCTATSPTPSSGRSPRG